MEKLEFQTGMKEFALENGGILRFNPRDPGVLERFMALEEKLGSLVPEGRTPGEKWAWADARCRELLEEVFPGNDFWALLGPGNSLALCENGRSVMGNFLDAVQLHLEEGAKMLVEEAVSLAKSRRGE